MCTGQLASSYKIHTKIKQNLCPAGTHSQVKETQGEFPGGLVVRTLCFHCWGSIPGHGKIPQATQCGQKKKKSKGDTNE